jgi:type I restriction enzyme S subunit
MKIKQAPLSKFVKINPEGITQGYPYQVIEYIDISSTGSGQLIEQPEEIMLKDAPSRAKRIVRDNDIILATVRPNLRSFLFIKNPNDNTVVSTGFAVLRAKETADPHFIYYSITDSRFTGYLTNNTKGTSYPAVDSDIVLRGNIPDFDFKRQQYIGEVLSSYDDLINTNRRRIQLLEEAARLLFREWFVYFRFPGYEKVKIIKDSISKTPEGWSKGKVVNVVKRVAPGELYDQATAEPTGIVPILDQGQSGIIGYHNNEPSVIASLNNPVIVFANHTCNQRIIHFPFSAIQNIFPFLPSDENYRNIYWLHYATDNLVQLNAYKGHWPEFMAKNIVLPPADLCEKFGNIISMIHKQLFYLSIQNQKLAQARDLLLPRLMSGAIDLLRYDKLTNEVEV